MQRPNPPTTREFRIGITFSAAVAFAVVLVNAVWLRSLVHDFATFYSGAMIVSHGNGPRLYDLQEQARMQQTLFGWEGVFVNNHPPFEALLFAPLAKLPYATAYIVWGAINVALWVFFVYLIRPYAPIPEHPLQYLMLCFLFFPLWVSLMQGQTSLLVLLLLSLSFVRLKRYDDFRAGVFLGLGLFKFAIVLPLALLCFLKGKWRLMGGFALAALTFGALSIVAVGPAAVLSYARLLIEAVKHPDNPACIVFESGTALSNMSAMPTVRGFLNALLAGTVAARSINAATAVVSLLLIVVTARRWAKQNQRARRAFDLMFAAALIVSQVTAGHALIHDLSPCVLAIVLVMSSHRRQEKWAWRLTANVAAGALYVLPLCLLVFQRQPMYLLAPVLVAFALAAFALSGGPDEPYPA